MPPLRSSLTTLWPIWKYIRSWILILLTPLTRQRKTSAAEYFQTEKNTKYQRKKLLSSRILFQKIKFLKEKMISETVKIMPPQTLGKVESKYSLGHVLLALQTTLLRKIVHFSVENIIFKAQFDGTTINQSINQSINQFKMLFHAVVRNHCLIKVIGVWIEVFLSYRESEKRVIFQKLSSKDGTAWLSFASSPQRDFLWKDNPQNSSNQSTHKKLSTDVSINEKNSQLGVQSPSVLQQIERFPMR